ncbi:hypothetical protein M405DRAFT_586600 [Rhizopogon salebrosus TDB-379]|nr:hypothetical protein M405DRAFT_586600 [Rhizopogon salebrosus TDB-379]
MVLFDLLQKQSPTLQECSPRQVLIIPDWTLPSVPCSTMTLYLLLLHHMLYMLAMSLSDTISARAITTAPVSTP